MAKEKPPRKPPDPAEWALVMSLGGPTRVAELLNTTVQCVQNWKIRGIPPKVMLERPDIFMPLLPQFRRGRVVMQQARAA